MRCRSLECCITARKLCTTRWCPARVAVDFRESPEPSTSKSTPTAPIATSWTTTFRGDTGWESHLKPDYPCSDGGHSAHVHRSAVAAVATLGRSIGTVAEPRGDPWPRLPGDGTGEVLGASAGGHARPDACCRRDLPQHTLGVRRLWGPGACGANVSFPLAGDIPRARTRVDRHNVGLGRLQLRGGHLKACHLCSELSASAGSRRRRSPPAIPDPSWRASRTARRPSTDRTMPQAMAISWGLGPVRLPRSS